MRSVGKTTRDDPLQPFGNVRCCGGKAAAQAVVARHEADGAVRRARWDPEMIVLTLNDEHLGPHDVELGQPAWPGRGSLVLWWLERECKADYACGSGQVGGAAGDPGARRTPTDDEG